jgi:hypothetical protein
MATDSEESFSENESSEMHDTETALFESIRVQEIVRNCPIFAVESLL